MTTTSGRTPRGTTAPVELAAEGRRNPSAAGTPLMWARTDPDTAWTIPAFWSDSCRYDSFIDGSEVGSRYCEALRGARAMREQRHWLPVAKAEGIAAPTGALAQVARFSGGKRRDATADEKAVGIPVGWFGR